MPHAFELRKEVEVHAGPDQVWDAIATGPGIDGWFIGSGNEVEPRLGGTVRLALGGEFGESTITAWDPPRRFAHRSGAGPDGSLHAMEYTVEARGGGTTVVRLVHSGFLGDDWESEYEALDQGDFMYLHQLVQYVTWFSGRKATVIAAVRPSVDRVDGLSRLLSALGIAGGAAEGQAVDVAPEGLPPIDGVVDFVTPGIVGVRAPDALYRFLFPAGVAYVGHHLYRDGVDVEATTAAWRAWLERTFA